MATIKLFSGTRNASSWAMRAWLALREAGMVFEEEIVDIRVPQRFDNLARIGAISPPASVPVLLVEGAVIFDSIAIMEYANDACGGALLPAPLARRAQARSIVAWQHAGLSGICSRISFESGFYPDKRNLTAGEQAEAAVLVRHLDELLRQENGSYLFSNLSLADLALVPTIVRLTRHDLDMSKHPRVRKWTEAMLDLPSVSEWLTEADRLPHIWFDNYLAD